MRRKAFIVSTIEFLAVIIALFMMIKIGIITGGVETTGYDYWGNPIVQYVYHRREFPEFLKTILRVRFYSGLAIYLLRLLLVKLNKHKIAGILTIPFVGVIGGILTLRIKDGYSSSRSSNSRSSSSYSESYDRDYDRSYSPSFSASSDNDVDVLKSSDSSDYGPKVTSNVNLDTGERGYSIDDRHYDSHGHSTGYDVDDRHYDSSGHSTGYRVGDYEYDARGNAIGYWNGDDFHKY